VPPTAWAVYLRFLPDEEELARALDRFEAHHHAFIAEFSH
jgi:hypothetical protein